MEIQKIFSDYYDEERLYSVLMDEDEMYLLTRMYADSEDESHVGRGALIGAGTTALAGAGLAGLGYGATKGMEKLAPWMEKRRTTKGLEKAVEKAAKADEAVKKAKREYKDAVKELSKNVNSTEKQLQKAIAWEEYEKTLKGAKERLGKEMSAREAGAFEKFLTKGKSYREKALEKIKNNKKLSIAASLGLIGAGAGVGAYRSRRRND